MLQIGIWLDKEKAHIVRLTNDTETFTTIYSEMEFYNPKGGSPSKLRWGAQDVVQDSKYLEREKHQFKNYFNKLAKAVKGADALAIFGPADTKDKFSKALYEHHKSLADKIRTQRTADSMTDNQVKALVRNFFKKKQ